MHAEAASPAVQALRKRLRIDAILADLPSLIEGLMEGAERSAAIVDGLKRFSATDRAAPSALTWLTPCAARRTGWKKPRRRMCSCCWTRQTRR